MYIIKLLSNNAFIYKDKYVKIIVLSVIQL